MDSNFSKTMEASMITMGFMLVSLANQFVEPVWAIIGFSLFVLTSAYVTIFHIISDFKHKYLCSFIIIAINLNKVYEGVFLN